jgi:cytochrome b561
MMGRSTAERWGGIAKFLHWGTALLVGGLFVLGWVAVNLPVSPTKLSAFFWHKSLGILVLGLTALRLLWRLTEPTPRLPPLPRWEVWAARASHGVLYLLLIAMPLSGWAIQSASQYPFAVFGWFSLPDLVPPGKESKTIAQGVHLALFWTLAAVLLVHVGAALRHHFLLGNAVLRRMLPGGSPRSPEENNR